MKKDTVLPRFHARFLSRRGAKTPEFLLEDKDIRFVAECERMRVDRNGSVLSVLLIALPVDHSSDADVEFLARVLEGRLRVTDSAGRLSDGRVAVLLPDTPKEGAWKVATDVSEVYPPGPSRPECAVLVYPDRGQDSSRRDSADESTVGPVSGDSEESSDLFFASALPFWKRVLDLTGAVIGIALTSPILMAAAVAVKVTSAGPVFFRQEREGIGGRRFRILKFRTMCVDAEKRQKELHALSHQDGPAFKMRGDPRTTKIGRFLRHTSIDELPQFFNVLQGDMSLVGPRPLPTKESLACEDWQRRRLSVLPGMTCIWQTKGRNSVRFDEWMRMDLDYIRRRSLLQDIKLMVITLPSLLLLRGPR